MRVSIPLLPVLSAGLFFAVALPGRLAAAPAAGADIVYAARYYKPGREVSQYHVWRIRPDGSGRVQVTSTATAADASPLWLADGRTILFVRAEGGTNRLCTVNENGGPVTTFAPAPGGLCGFTPDRRSLLFLRTDPPSRLLLMDLTTKRVRELGPGWNAALSPDGTKVYAGGPNGTETGRLVNLTEGRSISLRTNLGAGVWLSKERFVVEQSAPDPGQPRLCVFRADGTVEQEIPLPFRWNDALSPFADDLFAIPGEPGAILYGRHAGGSSQGPAHEFYRVDLRTGREQRLLTGLNVAWGPDGKSFCTAEGRDLADLDAKRQVWVAHLHIVTLPEGRRRTIVDGRVSVDGFDWRPAGSSGTGVKQ